MVHDSVLKVRVMAVSSFGKKMQLPCEECGYKHDWDERCPRCEAKKREEEDRKDKEEWEKQFEGMNDSQKLNWILEWIRKNRNSLNSGLTAMDIQQMIDSGPTCY